MGCVQTNAVNSEILPLHRQHPKQHSTCLLHGSTVVKVLRYKSEGRWFDPRWCQFFIDINRSDRTMALGSTQPLTEMSTRRISWG
jgi:hypothetical protein